MNHLQSEYAVLADPKNKIGHSQRAILIKEFSNLICSRLDWLQGRDRILVEMVYDRGFSYRTVAELTGMRPSSICRRARTLIRRLLSREYQICLLRRNQLSFLQLSIARERFVLGMSRSDIALRHRISLYSVDQNLQHLANLTGQFAAAPAKNHTEPMKEWA